MLTGRGFLDPSELRSSYARYWNIRSDTVFLNHGSFGATPKEICEYRNSLLKRMEQQPVDFIQREYMSGIPEVLEKLENFTGAASGSIVLLPNTTTSVNTVISNISIKPGDQLLTTGQEYFSSRNILSHNAARNGAELVEVPIHLPVEGPEQVIDQIMSAVTPRTLLVLVDHISSLTGMVFPIGVLIDRLSSIGIDVLVDGAHGPGMLPLTLTELGCAYYVGNCHKWMCAPKTSAFLYVRPDRQEEFRPAVMSHLATDYQIDMSDFQIEFFWNGTIDPTPRLSIPATLDFMEALHPGGWKGIMDENRKKALEAGGMICNRLGVAPPCPGGMQGSMAAIPLSWKSPAEIPAPEGIDPLQNWLLYKRNIEIHVTYTTIPKGRFLRLSAALYNGEAEFEYLMNSLLEAPAELL